MKNKLKKNKYFQGYKKLKHVKMFENFKDEAHDLQPDQLKKGSIYEIEVEGDKGSTDAFTFKGIVMDKNASEILVLDQEYFRLEKDKDKFKDIYKTMTLQMAKKEGFDEPLDECAYLYDYKGNVITTVLGFKVRFIVELD